MRLNTGIKFFLSFITLLIFLMIYNQGIVFSDGGGGVIFNGTKGGYNFTLKSIPEDITVGTTHFTIILQDSLTSSPILDAEIIVIAYDFEGLPTYKVRALNTPSFPEYYNTNLTIKSPGNWVLVVDITRPDYETQIFEIPVFVVDNSSTPGVAGLMVWLILVGVISTGFLYLWYSSRRMSKYRNLDHQI